MSGIPVIAQEIKADEPGLASLLRSDEAWRVISSPVLMQTRVPIIMEPRTHAFVSLLSKLLLMVDFISAQFGVEANQLTYRNLIEFFKEPRAENINLEFKSNNNEKKIPDKIYSTICAMLNSSGGLIILGAPKEKVNPTTGTKECCGALTPFSQKMKREDLMRSITDKIVPIPSDIDIFEIDDGNSNYVYLFQVQKSEYSPHQTDNRYYMKLDTETRIAPHYFIEALFRKVKYPDLKGRIEFLNIAFVDASYDYILIVFKVIIKNNSPLQNEEYPEYILSCNIGEPLGSHDPWPPRNQIVGNMLRSVHKPIEILHYGKSLERIYKIGLRSRDTDQLQKNNGKLTIFLQFGGRYSPLKYTFYAIDTSFFNRIEYDHFQTYRIPGERIESVESKLITDSKFDMDAVSNWNSLTS